MRQLNGLSQLAVAELDVLFADLGSEARTIIESGALKHDRLSSITRGWWLEALRTFNGEGYEDIVMRATLGREDLYSSIEKRERHLLAQLTDILRGVSILEYMQKLVLKQETGMDYYPRQIALEMYQAWKTLINKYDVSLTEDFLKGYYPYLDFICSTTSEKQLVRKYGSAVANKIMTQWFNIGNMIGVSE